MKKLLLLALLWAVPAAAQPIYNSLGEQRNVCKVWDGTDTADVLDLTNSNPLTCAIVDGAGSQITSFGGGTQYTEGDTDASITGTAFLWEDGSDTLRAASVAKPIPMRIGDGTDQVLVSAAGALAVDGSASTQPVSGTVTVTDGAGALNVIVDSGTTAVTQGVASILNAEVQGDAAHDAPGSGNPVLMGGAAWAAAPTDVSGDGDAVRAWHLRNGAAATVVTAAGALIGGDATNGLDVDVTRVQGTVTVSDGAGPLNVIVDSSALPSGASTLAEQQTQTTALQLIDNLPVAQGSTTSGQSGALVQGAVTTSAPSYTTAQTSPLSLQTDGDLRVNIEDELPAGTQNIGDVDVLTMPTTTVQATNLDVQIGGSDSLIIGTFPDNEPVNVGQINGVTPLMGNGASGTGAQRVTLANDSTGVLATVTTVGTVTNLTNLPNEGQQTAANSISTTIDTDNDNIGTPGSAVPARANYIGGTDGTNLTVPYIDPCQREARTVFVVDIVTATTTEIANQVASEFFYICSVNLISAGANNVAIVEDDTDACASPTAGLNGGVTAAEGWNFAANGGIAAGDGSNWIMKTGTANRYWCIITSAAVQLSGAISYVSAP